MTLQETFIMNLKKFRKKKGLSQMTLAELSDTTGNYIGQIEMGRRIPSFEKIERIASALRIASYQLFIEEMEDKGENSTETKPTAKAFLRELPRTIKEEITAHLLSAIHKDIAEAFNAKNY